MKTHFLQDQGVQTFHLEDSAQIFLLIASDEASITTDVKPIHCCVGIIMQRMAQLTSRTDSDSAKIWICCLKFNDVTWTMRHNNIMNDILTLVLLVSWSWDILCKCPRACVRTYWQCSLSRCGTRDTWPGWTLHVPWQPRGRCHQQRFVSSVNICWQPGAPVLPWRGPA